MLDSVVQTEYGYEHACAPKCPLYMCNSMPCIFYLPAVDPSYQASDADYQHLYYIELRAEATLHAKQRAENFMKAAHARGNKQWEVAQYYSQQVSLPRVDC